MMNRIKLVDLQRQYDTIKNELREAIDRTIGNTDFILGSEVERFEKNFAEMIGIPYAIGVSSGTSALLLSYLALGVDPGDKIITTPNTFIATVEPLILLGAEPIFVDIKDDGNINEDLIEERIDNGVKGIVAVHIYGKMVNMKKIRAIADRHNLFLVEDCAQAHLAESDGVKAGNFGDISCFSFYPGKNLGAYGDAGVIVTHNKDHYEKLKMLRNHGRKTKYEHTINGLGERMDGLQGAILNVKLKYLERWTKRRIEIAKIYNENLKNIANIDLPEVKDFEHVFHLYVVKVKKNRDKILNYLKEKGIGAGIHYPIPLHMQPVYYNRKYGKKYNDLPVSEDFAGRVISLPLFPEILDTEIKFLLKEFKNAVKKFG
jgi:dTDP-4-amino-4,6-dideoxygalactose transaminase